MPTGSAAGRCAGAAGFAYLALLVLLAVTLLALGSAALTIPMQAKREREAELLFAGQQYRRALASYYEQAPGGNHQYPATLDELLHDRRFIKPMRHLRRLYRDPVTGSAEWGLVRNEQRRIVGVYSRSAEAPVRTRFDGELAQLFGEEPLLSYADWKFVYRPAEGVAGIETSADEGDEATGFGLLEAGEAGLGDVAGEGSDAAGFGETGEDAPDGSAP